MTALVVVAFAAATAGYLALALRFSAAYEDDRARGEVEAALRRLREQEAALWAAYAPMVEAFVAAARQIGEALTPAIVAVGKACAQIVEAFRPLAAAFDAVIPPPAPPHRFVPPRVPPRDLGPAPRLTIPGPPRRRR